MKTNARATDIKRLTAIIIAINYHGVHISAAFQNLTTFGLLGIFAIFATLGLLRADTANLRPLFADTRGAAGGILSTLLVLQIMPYFMTGFEAAPKCSEEAPPISRQSISHALYFWRSAWEYSSKSWSSAW